MSVTVHKSENVQGQTITQVKECTGTDNYTYERNVQGQTIPQVKGMYRDRQFHRFKECTGTDFLMGGKVCSGTDNYFEFHFKSVSKYISEQLTRTFAVLVHQ